MNFRPPQQGRCFSFNSVPLDFTLIMYMYITNNVKIIMLTYKAPIGLRGWGAGVLYKGTCTQSTGIDTKRICLGNNAVGVETFSKQLVRVNHM